MPVDFVVCDADPCKCSPASDPDACCCALAAGAALIDGAPCAKCGAPLDVVMAPEDAAAQIIRESRSVMSFVAELGPGETREIDLEPSCAFRGERLSFAPRPQTRWQRAGAGVLHALRLPWLLLRSLEAVRMVLRPRPAEPWRDVDDPPRPSRGAELLELLRRIWRLPWPAPPIDLVNIKVGPASQIAGSGPVPAALFAFAPFDLTLDTARAGVKLTIVVRNTDRKPYTVRGAIIGTASALP